MYFPFHYGSTVLRTKNLSRVIDGRTIIKDINLEIKDIIRPGMTQGQIIAVLGPSGRGKSQLMMSIAGLLTPTTGEVLIGEDAHPVTLGQIGVVQQHYPVFMHRTVEDNLKVVAKGDSVEERINQILVTVGMDEHRKKYPAQLSGGQRQRIAIAQQVLCSQQFLLLDEPFSGLDPIMTRNISDLIRTVANLDEFNTVVIISHDIVAACALADTVILLGKSTDGTEGSVIRNQYNLAERGMAWQPGIENTAEFLDFIAKLRQEFLTL